MPARVLVLALLGHSLRGGLAVGLRRSESILRRSDPAEDSGPATCSQACDATKLQCMHKACEGHGGQEGPFKHCALAGADRPRMIYQKGCSGSTWVQKVARELLRLHGFCPSPVTFEPLHSGEINASFPDASVEKSMIRASKYWGQQGVTFVYKGTGEMDNLHLRSAMQERGTYAVVVWRRNAVDKAVCMARDCFSKVIGHAVDDDGQKSKLCFQRRTSNETARNLKVKINMDKVVQQVAFMSVAGKKFASELQEANYRGFETIAYEDLSDYEWSDSKWSNSTEAFDRGLEAWSRLLRSWGVTPNEEVLREYLLSGRQTRGVPKLHSNTIYNFDEVRQAIEAQMEAWPDFQTFLRY